MMGLQSRSSGSPGNLIIWREGSRLEVNTHDIQRPKLAEAFREQLKLSYLPSHARPAAQAFVSPDVNVR